jgi:hypothetical protein
LILFLILIFRSNIRSNQRIRFKDGGGRENPVKQGDGRNGCEPRTES